MAEEPLGRGELPSDLVLEGVVFDVVTMLSRSKTLRSVGGVSFVGEVPRLNA